jgi:hypothetical protein
MAARSRCTPARRSALAAGCFREAGPSGVRPQFPTGVLTQVSSSRDCTISVNAYRCTDYMVTGCSSIPDAQVTIARDANPAPNPIGMVTFFSGEAGTSFWGDGQLPGGSSFITTLKSAGYLTVQIEWPITPWLQAPPPGSLSGAGPAHRPSSISRPGRSSRRDR